MIVVIIDGSGRPVWRPPGPAVACPGVTFLQPGQTVSFDTIASAQNNQGQVLRNLAVGVYSVTGLSPELVAAFGRSYFAVC